MDSFMHLNNITVLNINANVIMLIVIIGTNQLYIVRCSFSIDIIMKIDSFFISHFSNSGNGLS